MDALSLAGQRWWQVLPLNPTDNALCNSPYSSYSAFAFNYLLISPEMLVEDGLLTNDDTICFADGSMGRVNFDVIYEKKKALIDLAFQRYRQRKFPIKAFEDFCVKQAGWLDDFALFVVLKSVFGNACWADWPVELKDRHAYALDAARRERAPALLREKFAQYLFYSQWMRLQKHCSARGIGLIGDIPIYVNYDSADVWVHPELFKLDGNKRQTFVAGVPPDYFSEEGQRWGNPVYDWTKLKHTGFAWWIERIRHNLIFFDLVRVDHFRGFAQCWEIPAHEKTAIKGEWKDVPGKEFFTALNRELGDLPIIAEDLGIITPDVDELKESFSFPGMRVIMFAFHHEYKKSRDLPENYTANSVVYTGTHDNNTLRGWFDNDMTEVERKNSTEYFGQPLEAEDVHWKIIALAMGSRANLCIIPLQDVLGLGQEARMNRPSTQKENWLWRFETEVLTPELLQRMRGLTIQANRL